MCVTMLGSNGLTVVWGRFYVHSKHGWNGIVWGVFLLIALIALGAFATILQGQPSRFGDPELDFALGLWGDSFPFSALMRKCQWMHFAQSVPRAITSLFRLLSKALLGTKPQKAVIGIERIPLLSKGCRPIKNIKKAFFCKWPFLFPDILSCLFEGYHFRFTDKNH